MTTTTDATDVAPYRRRTLLVLAADDVMWARIYRRDGDRNRSARLLNIAATRRRYLTTGVYRSVV